MRTDPPLTRHTRPNPTQANYLKNLPDFECVGCGGFYANCAAAAVHGVFLPLLRVLTPRLNSTHSTHPEQKKENRDLSCVGYVPSVSSSAEAPV